MSTRTPRCRQVRPKAAAPKRHRPERAPSGDDMFLWGVGERVEGVRRKPNLATDILARCAALYGPSTGEDK
jgi:hypothetical protein